MGAFYERLGVQPGASEGQVRAAYDRTLTRLVKKLRASRGAGGDTKIIEANRDALREAFEVLTDPGRKRRYDLFLQTDADGLPEDPQEIWAVIQSGMVDPTAAAGLDVVRALTSLPVGESFTAPELERTVPAVSIAPPPSLTPAASMLSPDERARRSAQALAAALPPAPTAATPAPKPVVQAVRPAPPPPPAPVGAFVPAALEPFDLPEPEPVYEPPPPAPQIADGRLIAAVRESKGLEIDALSEETRIASRYLQAIEENAFDRLPAAVFVRGYLKEIAEVLELDEDELVTGYMALYTRARGG